MTIPAHVEHLGGRFFKKPAKRAESLDVSGRVRQMLAEIRCEGSRAVRRYSCELDQWSPASFRCSSQEIEAAIASLDTDLRRSLDFSLGNIRRFAGEQRRVLQDLDVEILPGVRLGHRFKPIRNVGAYVPGGRYPLIASAFMTIATAKVAGVRRVVAAAPPNFRKGGIDPVQLAAIHLAGADEVYAIGGVQALGAMSFGVEGFGEPVDLLVGAGNCFVTEAKRQLFGDVGIDTLAGPSELAIIADAHARVDLVAADLLGQAEHGPTSEVVLLTRSVDLARGVSIEIDRQLKVLDTAATASAAWRDYGAIILGDDDDALVRLADAIATEHLEIQTANPEWFFARVDSYGTLFVGERATVAYSDKAIGTNHVLPTGRAARYTGGLWVGSFLRMLTHQCIEGASGAQVALATLAISIAEGMTGHGETARMRLELLNERGSAACPN
jgi:sulfopropanediol 3-dehydrogenase